MFAKMVFSNSWFWVSIFLHVFCQFCGACRFANLSRIWAGFGLVSNISAISWTHWVLSKVLHISNWNGSQVLGAGLSWACGLAVRLKCWQSWEPAVSYSFPDIYPILYQNLAKNGSKRKAPQPKLVPQETLDYLKFRPILSTKLLDRCFCPFYLVLNAGTALCCSDGVVLRRSRWSVCNCDTWRQEQ